MFDIIIVIIVVILCILLIACGISLARTNNLTQFTFGSVLIGIALLVGILFPIGFICRCPNCNSLFQNNGTNNYCSVCGKEFELNGKCYFCGAKNEYGKYCTQCGKTILLED